MAVTKAQKKQMLAEIEKGLKSAKSVVFTQYQGTNVKDMRALRKKLFESGVDLKVARKTLITIAAKNLKLEAIPNEFMVGPIALAFSEKDEIAAPKIIHEFAKTHESIKIAGAIFESKMMAAADVKVIAALPSKEVLIAKFMGSLKSPVYGFYSVLHGLLRNFVYCMSEVQKKKPASA